MRKISIIVIALVIIFIIGFIMVGPIMSRVEQPQYTVIKKYKNIELREYKPMIIAEVQVEGERKQAINEGFKILADYIFGNNELANKISMTAPVAQAEGSKIAMTAPVKQQQFSNSWKISFVMPAKYTMENIPKPKNRQVSLKQVAKTQYAVIKFRGRNKNDNIAMHEQVLMEFMVEHKLAAKSKPLYAFYNPPWTLPLMRRNEILFQIEIHQP